MRNIARTTFILILFVLSINHAWGQNNPVTATIQITPPNTPAIYSLISDLNIPPKLSLTVLLNDANETNYPVKFKLIIEGQGISIRTKPNFLPAPTYLDYGIPRILSGSHFQEYFNPDNLDFQGFDKSVFINNGGVLPEGIYSICFEVYDYFRDEVSISNTNCQIVNLEEHSPAVLIEPIGFYNNITFPQSVLFTWQPMHFPGFLSENELTLYEVTDNFSDDQIISFTAPLYTTVTNANNYFYGPTAPMLERNKEYMWRIKTTSVLSNELFKNDGYSQTGRFIYGNRLLSPPVVDGPFGTIDCDAPQLLNIAWHPTHQEVLPVQYELSIYSTTNLNPSSPIPPGTSSTSQVPAKNSTETPAGDLGGDGRNQRTTTNSNSNTNSPNNTQENTANSGKTTTNSNSQSPFNTSDSVRGNATTSQSPLLPNVNDLFLVYETTTLDPSFIYGAELPRIVCGEEYYIQVRIIKAGESTAGPNPYVEFDNNGLSALLPFNCNDACYSPTIVSAEATSETEITIEWEGGLVHETYQIDYRLTGNAEASWISVESTEQSIVLSDLKRRSEYELKVGGACPDSLMFSDVVTVELVGESLYECGGNFVALDIENMTPLPILAEDDIIYAGDFEVKIDEVTGGGSGIFSGKGHIFVPMFQMAKVNVEFSSISINNEYYLYGGDFNVTGIATDLLSDEMEELLGGVLSALETIDQALAVAEEVLTTIIAILDEIEGTSGYFSDGWTGMGLNIPGAIYEEYPYLPEGTADNLMPALLCYLEGTPEECQEGLQTAVSEIVDALNELYDANVQVVFEKHEEQLYGSDFWSSTRNDGLNTLYNKVTIAGEDYYVGWKSIKSVNSDKVDVKGTIPNNITFEDNVKAVIPRSGNTLTIPGGINNDVKQIYAVERTTNAENEEEIHLAGKLNVISYDEELIDIVMIPVNGATYPYNEATFKTKLQEIYDPAVVKTNVTFHPGIQVNGFTGTLNDVGSGPLSNYTSQMKDIANVFKNQMEDGKYYFFMVANNSNASKLGYMPRGKSSAFIYNGSHSTEDQYINTVAHELGHGAFVLEHIFDTHDLQEGATDNLMDYSDGTHLHKYQWDLIHDPIRTWLLFDDDEDAENLTLAGYFKNKDFGFNNDQTFTFMTPSGQYIVLPDTVRDVTVYFGYYGESTQGEITDFLYFTPGTLKSFTLGTKKFSASVNFGAANVLPMLNGYYNDTEEYKASDYNINSATSFNGNVILWGSEQSSYNFYHLLASNVTVFQAPAVFVDVLNFPVQYTGSSVDKYTLSYTQYNNLFGDSQHSLTKENVDWAFGTGWQASEETFLLRNKIAELKQAYPTLIDYVTKDYDRWQLCDPDHFSKPNYSFEFYLSTSYCDCTVNPGSGSNYSTSTTTCNANSFTPRPSSKLEFLTEYFNWFKSNALQISISNVATLQQWNADPTLIDPITDMSELCMPVNIAAPNDLKSLNANTIIKILSKLANQGLFDNANPNQDGEGAVVALMENVSKEVSDAVIIGLEAQNQYNTSQFLYRQIFKRTNDKVLGFFGDNNRLKVISACAKICLQSQTIYSERLNDLVTKLDTRQFILEYQNIILRTLESLVVESVSYQMLGNDYFEEWTKDYDLEVEYQQQEGVFDVTQQLQQGLFTEEDLFTAEDLSPFDLVYFVNKTNLNLLKSFDTNNPDIKDLPVPAIVLMYAEDAASTETVSQTVYTVIDVASLALGPGALATVGKLGKALNYVDMVSDIASLGATASSDFANPQITSILNTVSAITGLTSITAAAGKKVKNVFNDPNLATPPNPKSIADEVNNTANLTPEELATLVSDDNIFVRLSYVLKKGLQNSPDAATTTKINNAIDKLQIAKNLANQSADFNIANHVIVLLKTAEDIKPSLTKLETLNNTDGFIDIVVHGSDSKFIINGGESIPIENLAIYLSSTYPNNKNLRLLSCADIQGSQNLVDALGSGYKVHATDGLVRIHGNGGITTVPRQTNGSTEWYQLTPNSNPVTLSAGLKPKPPTSTELSHLRNFVELSNMPPPKQLLASINDGITYPNIKDKLNTTELKNKFAEDWANRPQSDLDDLDANPSWVEAWIAFDKASKPANKMNLSRLEILADLKAHPKISAINVDINALAKIEGFDNLFTFEQICDKVKVMLDTALPNHSKIKNLERFLGSQGLGNGGYATRRHAYYLMQRVIDNKTFYKTADEVKFELHGPDQLVYNVHNRTFTTEPDLRVKKGTDFYINEAKTHRPINSGHFLESSNLADQSIRQIANGLLKSNDVKRFRVTLHPDTKALVTTNKATWKQNVVNAFENREGGAFLKDLNIQNLFNQYRLVTNNPAGPMINSEATLKAYLQNNDEWYELMFNSFF